MIVSKFEEIYPPSVKDYVAVCDGAFSKEEITTMEANILAQLNFTITTTSTFTILTHTNVYLKLEPKIFSFT